MCRKRKIRCDETRPFCKKCATHGVACPGYRTEEGSGGLEFRDQTGLTVQRAELRYREQNGLSKGRKSSSSSDSSCAGDGGVVEALMPYQSAQSAGSESISPAFTDLLSPAVVRTQLYSTFMDLYLPQVSSGMRLDHFSFYQLLATSPTTESALLESLDALSLVSIGSLSKDRTFLTQSVRTYGKALTSLRKAIVKPGALHNDHLLAATNVLSQCAFYEEIAQRANGWSTHTQGCQQLIAARGPESLHSELALLLFSNLRHGALCAALIQRKAPFMARGEWRAKAREMQGLGRDWSTGFYDAAMLVPGLLERHDRLTMAAAVSEMVDTFVLVELDDLLAECEVLEQKLRECMADWQEQALLNESWTHIFEVGGSFFYSERPIADFPSFCAVCPDRTFTSAFTFPSFQIAYMASLYWLCMHFLRSTVQSLHKLRHAIDSCWFPKTEQAVEEDELLKLTFNLCKTLPFFCEPASGSTGHVGIFLPMRTAAIYFTQRGHWGYAKWVRAVRDSVFTKGLSPPNVGNSFVPTSDIVGARTAPRTMGLSSPSLVSETSSGDGEDPLVPAPAATAGNVPEKAMLTAAWKAFQSSQAATSPDSSIISEVHTGSSSSTWTSYT